MKIITKTTFVVGKAKTVEPGETIELDDEEALGLIQRGLAQPLPAKPVKADTSANDSSSSGDLPKV